MTFQHVLIYTECRSHTTSYQLSSNPGFQPSSYTEELHLQNKY